MFEKQSQQECFVSLYDQFIIMADFIIGIFIVFFTNSLSFSEYIIWEN